MQRQPQVAVLTPVWGMALAAGRRRSATGEVTVLLEARGVLAGRVTTGVEGLPSDSPPESRDSESVIRACIALTTLSVVRKNDSVSQSVFKQNIIINETILVTQQNI